MNLNKFMRLCVFLAFYGISAISIVSAVFVAVSNLGWFATTVAVLNALSVLSETIIYEIDRRKMKRFKKEMEELRLMRLQDFN